ncbi:MAG TPA: AAA family ATPase [Polyangiaceae bacterium]
MPKSDQLKTLIESFAESDDARFYRTALQLAADEARRGHGKLAQELRDLVDAVRARGAALPAGGKRPIPIAQPRGDLGDLITASYPDLRFSDMVLSDELAKSLNRVLRENHNLEKLRSHGLRPRRKLLLVGPPGTGKTMTARAIAGELHLPLYFVRFESVITKYMGETAAKLKLVFDAMNTTRAVFLFDEFDAIGGERALPNDTGEIRRILNSFLQFIEADDSESILVAATNHPRLLDLALLRRFDDVLNYSMPDRVALVGTLKRTLADFPTDGINWQRVAEVADGLSYAEVVRACEDAAKDSLLAEHRVLSEAVVVSAIRERLATRDSIAGK